MTLLLRSTLDFLNIVFMADAFFELIFLDVTMRSVVPEHDKVMTPDEFVINFEILLTLDPAADTPLDHAIEIMVKSNWSKYLNTYVQQRPGLGGPKPERTALNDIIMVTYQGTETAS